MLCVVFVVVDVFVQAFLVHVCWRCCFVMFVDVVVVVVVDRCCCGLLCLRLLLWMMLMFFVAF